MPPRHLLQRWCVGGNLHGVCFCFCQAAECFVEPFSMMCVLGGHLAQQQVRASAHYLLAEQACYL